MATNAKQNDLLLEIPDNLKTKSARTADKFASLVELMRLLRSDDGCPWDREQNHETLLPHLIEETYELVDAIRGGDMQEVKEELGDLLLQVVFHAQMADENDDFAAFDVITAIHDKLYHRHPHVFGDQKGQVKTADEVKQVWSKAKRKEGKKSLLGGVPKAMPSLQRAWRLSDKASTIGFDWPDISGVWKKVEEELSELKDDVATGKQDKLAEELGDVLFCLVNLGRYLKVDPELALQKTNDKFQKRFAHMEASAQEDGKALADISRDKLESLWLEAKKA